MDEFDKCLCLIPVEKSFISGVYGNSDLSLGDIADRVKNGFKGIEVSPLRRRGDEGYFGAFLFEPSAIMIALDRSNSPLVRVRSMGLRLDELVRTTQRVVEIASISPVYSPNFVVEGEEALLENTCGVISDATRKPFNAIYENMSYQNFLRAYNGLSINAAKQLAAQKFGPI